MVKCVVKSCNSNSGRHSKADNITFHRVPKDQNRMEKWIKNIRLLRKETDWLPSKVTLICSKHFRDTDKILPKHGSGYIRLANDAVPMLDEAKVPVQTEEDLNIETDDEMMEVIESIRENKMKNIIKRLKDVSSRRLKCIKNLRQKNKRLRLKTKKLTAIVKELKKLHNINEINEEEEESDGSLDPDLA